MAEQAPFEKNVQPRDPDVEIAHGELNPAPEVPPANENKEPGKDGDKKSESNVTVPASNAPAFTVPNPASLDLGGRSMAVVAPRQ